MIENILLEKEGRTLEFKENAHSLLNIIKTVVAFANTAGGTLIIGVENKTKKIVGVEKPLDQEERLINCISDSIAPFLIPEIEIHTYRNKDLIIIKIPHSAGPFYVKAAGIEKGVFVRSGSSDRVADEEMLDSLKLYAKKMTFDEVPFFGKPNLINMDIIKDSFQFSHKTITPKKLESLGLLVSHGGTMCPSNGGMILFGHTRGIAFPDAIIRCVRFAGVGKTDVIDHRIIKTYPILALEEALQFIERNTYRGAIIGRIKRTDIPQYPPIAIREALINSLLHADYSIKGSSTMIAIFEDRIEISNPGGLRFGLTLEDAIAGSSKIRNRVIARIFNELGLIEQWGSGLKKIIESCAQRGLEAPLFEERITEFKVTIFAGQELKISVNESQKTLIEFMKKKGRVSTKEAAEFLKISPRAARTRLKSLLDSGFIIKVGTSHKDPYGVYTLVNSLEKKSSDSS